MEFLLELIEQTKEIYTWKLDDLFRGFCLVSFTVVEKYMGYVYHKLLCLHPLLKTCEDNNAPNLWHRACLSSQFWHHYSVRSTKESRNFYWASFKTAFQCDAH
jgi:hypothetical protein